MSSCVSDEQSPDHALVLSVMLPHLALEELDASLAQCDGSWVCDLLAKNFSQGNRPLSIFRLPNDYLIPEPMADGLWLRARAKIRLTRIIHDGSLRNRAVAWRDERVEPRGPDAYLKQYVEGLSGEPTRLHAGNLHAGLS